MQLTYGNTTHSTIQAILAEGETLGILEGPGVFFMQVNGDDPVYRSILEEYAENLDDEQNDKGGKKAKHPKKSDYSDLSDRDPTDPRSRENMPGGLDPHGYPYIGRYGAKITEQAIAALVADVKDPLATDEAREAQEAFQKKRQDEIEERARAQQTDAQHAASDQQNKRSKKDREKDLEQPGAAEHPNPAAKPAPAGASSPADADDDDNDKHGKGHRKHK